MVDEDFDSLQDMILDLKEGDAVEIICSGLKASFGTRPRQKSRERISHDKDWVFQGEVVSVKDDRDRYKEKAEFRGVDPEELKLCNKKEVLVEGYDSRDDWSEEKTWRIKVFFDGSDKIKMVEVPGILDIDASPGADSPIRTEVEDMEFTVL